MIWNIFQWYSLKTRVTLFTLAIFVISIWSLAIYASRMLREDLTQLLSDQQFSTASFVAAQVSDELGDRLGGLEKVAAKMPPAIMNSTAAVQAFLEQRPILQSLFNGGIIAYRPDGTAIAEIPLSAGRVGINYMDLDTVAAALREGKPSVSRPVLGKKLRKPVIGITVPVRDAQGKVIGALSGVTNLGIPNFLDKITESSYGKSGGYLLVAREHRLVVTASDKSRVMETLPAAGVSPMIDRFIQGYEGTGIFVNPLGVEVLSSVKAVPAAGWNVVVMLPTAEAFAPIYAMQRRMLLATLLLTVLAGGLTWWMLRRQLAPMLAAARALAGWSATAPHAQPLPVVTQDETGQLIGGFNRVLQTLSQREQELQVHQVELQSQNEELRRAQQELELARARYFDLYDLAPVGYWTLSEQGLILQANLTVATLLGVVRGALIGQPMSRFVLEQDRHIYYRYSAQLMDSGEPLACDLRLAAKGGTPLWVHLAAVVAHEHDGAPVLRIALTDISERKETEQALRESETRYRVLAETAADAFVTADAQGSIVGWNAAAERMFGYSQEQIIGQPLIRIMPERYREAHRRGMSRAAGHDARGLATQALELHGLAQDGHEIPVELSLSRWSTANGIFFTAVLRDTTERKRLEQVHLRAQKLESLGTLAGGIAHDFNNILAAIRGNADLAAEDVGHDHIASGSLEEIRKASTRARELVRRIMAFGRPQEARPVVVDLAAVVDEVLKLLRSTLPAGITLRQSFAGDMPQVLADAGQVHEAIVNLTTNAAYAIGPRAGSIEYRLALLEAAPAGGGAAPQRYVRLTVADSGSGMDAATQERIFDVFYTTKPVGEGTGLGLSMVHGIMKSHGGSVSVESAPGKGTRIHLDFPVAPALAQGEAQQAVVPPVAADLLLPGQRVLYVDDEEALVFLGTRVLSRLGHSIVGFTDPAAALAAFRAHPQDFDLVVTDLAMPSMSGFDLARAVLALRPQLPVLMTSGYVRAEDEATAREIGIREVMLKPVTVAELGRVLGRMFNLRPPDA